MMNLFFEQVHDLPNTKVCSISKKLVEFTCVFTYVTYLDLFLTLYFVDPLRFVFSYI